MGEDHKSLSTSFKAAEKEASAHIASELHKNLQANLVQPQVSLFDIIWLSGWAAFEPLYE